MQTVKDFLYNDFTACYELTTGKHPTQNTMSWDIDHYKPKELYYFDSCLSFGDYDNSCAVERANYRVFRERFKDHKDVVFIGGWYGWQAVGIDIFCEDEEIIELLSALANYPAIDDMAVSEVEQELKEESWDSIKWDIHRAIKTTFEIDIDDYEFNDDELNTWFYNAAEEANIYGHVEAGGNYYIDTTRIIESLENLPDFLTAHPIQTEDI